MAAISWEEIHLVPVRVLSGKKEVHQMKKRVVSLILAFVMILSCVPTAFAAGVDSGSRNSSAVGPWA